jgi:hypothetical protein
MIKDVIIHKRLALKVCAPVHPSPSLEYSLEMATHADTGIEAQVRQWMKDGKKRIAALNSNC